MSYADKTFLESCVKILSSGLSDYGYPVRSMWEDGTPAHTRKALYVVNKYDLSKEFPAMTLRKIAFKNAIDEILWIYQKKSNNINDLQSHIWDSWADESGSIGKAYGYQMAQIHHYPEGDFTQIDKVIYDLKNNPMSRSIMTNMYNHADLSEMHLRPCAYSMTYNVTLDSHGEFVLNGMLNQRSQDMLTANNWNTVQYSALIHMLAQICNMKVGIFTHVIADAHIYDRHIPIVVEMLREVVLDRYEQDVHDTVNRPELIDNIRTMPIDTEQEAMELFDCMYRYGFLLRYIENNDFSLYPKKAPDLWLYPNDYSFEKFTVDSLALLNYEYLPFRYKIPVAV